MQFIWLREPIVVIVDPEQKLRIDCVFVVNDPVPVPPVLGLVELRQGQKAIWVWRRWLRREVAEQLSAIVNRAVAIAVQSKEGIC